MTNKGGDGKQTVKLWTLVESQWKCTRTHRLLESQKSLETWFQPRMRHKIISGANIWRVSTYLRNHPKYRAQLMVGIVVRTVKVAGHISQFFLAAQIFFNFTIASTATMPSFSNAPLAWCRSPSSVGAPTNLSGGIGHNSETRQEKGLGRPRGPAQNTLAPQPTRANTQSIKVTFGKNNKYYQFDGSSF